MKNKKIGILTFHRADNMGAVLQAFALQKVLNKNADCEIIDYLCKTVEATKHAGSGNGLKGRLKASLKAMYYMLKHRGFEKFRKRYLKLSSRQFCQSDISDCAEEYSVFITGSDQVWNLSCSGNDMTYFLDFAPDDTLKLSYAASIGNYSYSDNEKNTISPLLNRFSAISIREASAADTLCGLGISAATITCDPVMLLGSDEWQRIKSQRLYRKKYILVYLIQEDVNVLRSATEYARKHNCKIISNKKSPRFILHNSPRDFLSWIYYSDAVFTNSFHGTAFALIFGKKLFADTELKDGGINNRVHELLSATDSLDCVIKNNDTSEHIPHSSEKLSHLRDTSLAFLEENIKFC